jgi:hypothetical protein
MPPVGLDPTIPVNERPKTHALDRTATGIGIVVNTLHKGDTKYNNNNNNNELQSL